MERLNAQRLQLEQQINTLESANLNYETMQAMKKASDALEQIHGRMLVWFWRHLCFELRVSLGN